MPEAPIDRLSPQDLVALVTDVGPVPMQVGAVLVLADVDAVRRQDLRSAISERIAAVPRLRRRLVRPGLGGGRPIWVDDADFDVHRHLRTVCCPEPGDEQALLDVAADLVTRPLPHDRPLWQATLVTGLERGRAALVVTFHHVLADGIGGLALLGALVDGRAAGVDPAFPRPAPTWPDLAADAARDKVEALRRLPVAVRGLRAALARTRTAAHEQPAASSLNQVTGTRRRLSVVRTDVGAVRSLAREGGATVNDVVLTAATGALRRLLASRGEASDHLVFSVPMSTRDRRDGDALGNAVALAPVALPVGGSGRARLAAVAARTRAAKATRHAASTALLGPAFRLLARLGLFRLLIEHQRLVNSFTTTLHGPEEAVRMLGTEVEACLPLAVVSGNVTVSFASLSYAGTLATVVVTDPDVCPDLDVLDAALQDELRVLLGGPGADPATAGAADSRHG